MYQSCESKIFILDDPACVRWTYHLLVTPPIEVLSRWQGKNGVRMNLE